ncbi:MAG: cyclic nucleotide-binding domain-containing protein [Acidimicrobiia bacterium]
MRRQLRTELLDELAGVPLFAGLWRRDLQRVAAAVEVIDIDPGDEVVRQSDAGHDLYVIVRGSATVVEDGRPAAMLGAGDTFGETGVFAGAPPPRERGRRRPVATGRARAPGGLRAAARRAPGRAAPAAGDGRPARATGRTSRRFSSEHRSFAPWASSF